MTTARLEDQALKQVINSMGIDSKLEEKQTYAQLDKAFLDALSIDNIDELLKMAIEKRNRWAFLWLMNESFHPGNKPKSNIIVLKYALTYPDNGLESKDPEIVKKRDMLNFVIQWFKLDPNFWCNLASSFIKDAIEHLNFYYLMRMMNADFSADCNGNYGFMKIGPRQAMMAKIGNQLGDTPQAFAFINWMLNTPAFIKLFNERSCDDPAEKVLIGINELQNIVYKCIKNNYFDLATQLVKFGFSTCYQPLNQYDDTLFEVLRNYQDKKDNQEKCMAFLKLLASTGAKGMKQKPEYDFNFLIMTQLGPIVYKEREWSLALDTQNILICETLLKSFTCSNEVNRLQTILLKYKNGQMKYDFMMSILKILYQYKIPATKQDFDIALEINDLNLIKLLKAFYQLDAIMDEKHIVKAAEMGNEEISKLILDNLANKNISIHQEKLFGKSCPSLKKAAAKGHINVVKVLLENKAHCTDSVLKKATSELKDQDKTLTHQRTIHYLTAVLKIRANKLAEASKSIIKLNEEDKLDLIRLIVSVDNRQDKAFVNLFGELYNKAFKPKIENTEVKAIIPPIRPEPSAPILSSSDVTYTRVINQQNSLLTPSAPSLAQETPATIIPKMEVKPSLSSSSPQPSAPELPPVLPTPSAPKLSVDQAKQQSITISEKTSIPSNPATPPEKTKAVEQVETVAKESKRNTSAAITSAIQAIASSPVQVQSSQPVCLPLVPKMAIENKTNSPRVKSVESVVNVAASIAAVANAQPTVEPKMLVPNMTSSMIENTSNEDQPGLDLSANQEMKKASSMGLFANYNYSVLDLENEIEFAKRILDITKRSGFFWQGKEGAELQSRLKLFSLKKITEMNETIKTTSYTM